MLKKILCTLGTTSLNPRTIIKLTDLEVDLFRLNLSHTPVDSIEKWVRLINDHSDTPVCLDTQGAQMRTGSFARGSVYLQTGAIVELAAAPDIGNKSKIPLYPSLVLPQLSIGDMITLDTEAVPLQVIEKSETIRARVMQGGNVGSNKATSVDRAIALPHLTDADREAIQIGLKLGIKHFALSFANRRSDVESLRSLVGDEVQIIAKIESRLGLQNLIDIMEASDAILIDRGDLSREVAIERIPFVQKEIISKANSAAIPVYVATNLLESMVTSPRPTRAEVNDVINTLLDGADGLVLAAETAIGEFPVQCVRMIRSMISQYESHSNVSGFDQLDSTTSALVAPHGGTLVQRVFSDYDAQAIDSLGRLMVSPRVMMDAAQIGIGTFSPLKGFMGKEDLESVLEYNRLADGTAWPMPVLMQLPTDSRDSYTRGETLALTTGGVPEALLHVEENFNYNLEELAKKWFGTSDSGHAGVAMLFQGGNRFLGGTVDLLSSSMLQRQPQELTPAQARTIFEARQWQKVVGFHTRNVPHRAHEYLQFTAMNEHLCDGIFIHPVIGPKKSGDFSSDIILKSYQLLIDQFYASGEALLSGFMTYSRYAGPREAIFTAICRQNFGCSHFIVGRDHTGVGNFYQPDASQRMFDEFGDISITPVFFKEVYYCQACGNHVEKCQHGSNSSKSISGTSARERLRQGLTVPDWYIREPISNLILDELKNGQEVFVR